MISKANADSFESKVKKAIEASGLPTEITATKILTDYGWRVQNEYPYVDRENKRVRTLDIKATATFSKNKGNNPKPIVDYFKDANICELYIECKKSDKPWVFYLDTMTNAELFFTFDRFTENIRTNSNTINNVVKSSEKLVTNTEAYEEGKLPKSILTEIPIKFKILKYHISLSHQIVFAKTNEPKSTMDEKKLKDRIDEGKDEIYSAEMQIFKALNHQEKMEKRNSSIPNGRRLIIPIILLNGNLFGCYYENQELLTPKIEYTRHLAHGLPHQQVPALIDVVTLNYFPQYIRLLTKEIVSLLP